MKGSTLAVVALLACPMMARGADVAWWDGGETPMFPKGTQDFTLTGAYAHPFGTGGNDNEFGGQDEKFIQFTQGYGYSFLDNFAINPKLTEHYVIGDDGDSVGIDFALTLRWHVLQVDRWTFFVQGGGGLAYFTRRVPEGTTNFNFESQVGPGFTYKLEENMHLIGGVDWLHFSNAEIAGAQRHGSSNTARFYFGLMWTF